MSKVADTTFTRKIEQIGLSFPYDWSNPELSDFALIWKVLERENFEDVMRICWHFGLREVRGVHGQMPRNPLRDQILGRMMDNIEKGFALAKRERQYAA